MSFFKRLFWGSGKNQEPAPKTDIPKIITQIETKEQARDIPLGRKIHDFDYGMLSVRLDRDITKSYRITVWQGKERLYSFTVQTNQGNYKQLQQAYNIIINFLNGDQNLSHLPDNDLVKGFYYGH
ncbi:MAG: hypothetical protein FH748_08020 [Balneolaceae bacterium]|nr:hypothetical protein [Balneolaceae bacterium]